MPLLCRPISPRRGGRAGRQERAVLLRQGAPSSDLKRDAPPRRGAQLSECPVPPTGAAGAAIVDADAEGGHFAWCGRRLGCSARPVWPPERVCARRLSSVLRRCTCVVV